MGANPDSNLSLTQRTESNLFIALVASLASVSPFIVFHKSIDWNIPFIVLCATFITYNLQRFITGSSSFRDATIVNKALFIAAIVILGVLTLKLDILQIVLLVLAGLLSVMYALPVLPYRSKKYSLREVPFLKIWIITLVWVLVICVLPVLSFSETFTDDLKLSILLFSAQQGAFIMALTIPFDIRDLDVDKEYQRTLPMILGRSRSISLANSLLWTSFFLCAVNFLFGFFDLDVVFFQLLTVLVSYRVIRKAKEKQPPSYYTLMIDGMIGVQSVLFILSYFISISGFLNWMFCFSNS